MYSVWIRSICVSFWAGEISPDLIRVANGRSATKLGACSAPIIRQQNMAKVWNFEFAMACDTIASMSKKSPALSYIVAVGIMPGGVALPRVTSTAHYVISYTLVKLLVGSQQFFFFFSRELVPPPHPTTLHRPGPLFDLFVAELLPRPGHLA